MSSGRHSARLIRRAQILLRSSDSWTDETIATALGVSRQTVYTVRKQALSDGVAASLKRTAGRKAGHVAKALDGWLKPIWWR